MHRKHYLIWYEVISQQFQIQIIAFAYTDKVDPNDLF